MNTDELIEFLEQRLVERRTFARGIINGVLHFYTKGRWTKATDVEPIDIPTNG
jgi:hypothetical protein